MAAQASQRHARLLVRPQALVAWTIVISTAFRFVLAAAAIDFGKSEAYYIATARHLALSYFDHPPLSFWMTWAVLKLTGSDALLVVRTPFIALFIATTWLTYRLGAELFNERAGALAALLLNVSPLFTVSIGAWVQPDGPLVCFLLASTLCVVRLAYGPESGHRMLVWMQAGFWLGLAMLSKYYAVLLAVGFIVFALTSPAHRRWFGEPGPYVAGIVVLAVFSPVLIWNYQNDWVSFGFQGGRFFENNGLLLRSLSSSILGQAGLVGPWIWAPMIYFGARALWNGPQDSKPWLLAITGAMPIVLFTANALWTPVSGHFHWQAPGYLMLFPLLGKLTAERLSEGILATKRWVTASVWAMPLIIVLVGAQAITGWARVLVPNSLSELVNPDPTLKGLGWASLRPAIAAHGLLQKPQLFVVSVGIREVGRIDFELGKFLPVVCLCQDPRNIAFLWDTHDFEGWDALIVVTDEAVPLIQAEYGQNFRKIQFLDKVDIRRANDIVLTVHVYYASDYYKPYQLPLTAHWTTRLRQGNGLGPQ